MYSVYKWLFKVEKNCKAKKGSYKTVVADLFLIYLLMIVPISMTDSIELRWLMIGMVAFGALLCLNWLIASLVEVLVSIGRSVLSRWTEVNKNI